MRPCATDALPIIGSVPRVEGAFLACAHNCWGILWGPITGRDLYASLACGLPRPEGTSSAITPAHTAPADPGCRQGSCRAAGGRQVIELGPESLLPGPICSSQGPRGTRQAAGRHVSRGAVVTPHLQKAQGHRMQMEWVPESVVKAGRWEDKLYAERRYFLIS
jgi:hypothetical protein